MIFIHDIEEYHKYNKFWLDPLVHPDLFLIPLSVRKQLSLEFGKQSERNDQKFYKYIWKIKPHWCENCGEPLRGYDSVFISHIKTKGAWTEYRYDPQNTNILCFNCHNKWEYAKLEQKKKMYVFWKNRFTNIYYD